MIFPNRFKIIWWILLLLITGRILYTRLGAIATGDSVPADAFIFLIFVALMLLPLFSEIEFFGIKLKKEIDELKKNIDIRLGDIKNEIRNNQSQTLNANFHGWGPPPPDNKLPELSEEIDRIVKAKLEEHRVTIDKSSINTIDVPNDNLQLFKVRYNIETQLRRIWEQRFKKNESKKDEFDTRNQSTVKIIHDLTKYEIINNDFYEILREILSICNYAIHGNNVTENQVSFVNKNAKQVIEYLSQVK